MLLEIILALILGITMGTLTGLLPGIHINLVASLILLLAVSHGSLSLPFAVFIVSLSFTHILIDFIPTTLLGVPNDENFLATLPAHRLVKQGLALKAIRISFLGVLFSVPLVILVAPIYILFLPEIYRTIESFIPYALVASSLYLVFREKNVLSALVIFILAGILGYLNFQLPIKEPLLPLLTGLFGLSSLFSGMGQKESIPKQKSEVKIPRKTYFLRSIIPASIVTPLCSFFPGIGSGHISLFCSEIVRQNSKRFIFLTGLVASMNMALSIVAAYAISRTRSGSAVAIQTLLEPFSLTELLIMLAFFVITTLIVYYIGNKLAKQLVFVYNSVPHKKITLITIAFVILLNLSLTNSLGIIVLAASTALGLFAHYLKIRKIQLMGALLLPTILYYFM